MPNRAQRINCRRIRDADSDATHCRIPNPYVRDRVSLRRWSLRNSRWRHLNWLINCCNRIIFSTLIRAFFNVWSISLRWPVDCCVQIKSSSVGNDSDVGPIWSNNGPIESHGSSFTTKITNMTILKTLHWKRSSASRFWQWRRQGRRRLSIAFRVKSFVGVSNDPLLELDRNGKKFELCIEHSEPVLNLVDLKDFLPCTCNLDPYLNKLIRGEWSNLRASRRMRLFRITGILSDESCWSGRSDRWRPVALLSSSWCSVRLKTILTLSVRRGNVWMI